MSYVYSISTLVKKILILEGILFWMLRSYPDPTKTHGLVSATFDTVCPRSSYPFYMVSYFIKRVTTAWTYSRVDQKLKRFKILSNFIPYFEHYTGTETWSKTVV